MRIEIDGLAAGGDGVGRVDGRVVFVPFTAPGDAAQVRVVSEHRSFCRAALVELLESSPLRVEPPCPLFGDCGGCQWQHLSPSAQRDAKRTLVEDALRRVGKITGAAVPEVIPSPRDYGYRHRTRLHIALGGKNPMRFGFYRARTHRVVPVPRCPLLHPSLNILVSFLPDLARRHGREMRNFREARLFADYEGTTVQALFSTGSGRLALPASMAATLRRMAGEGGLTFAGDRPLRLGPEENAPSADGRVFTQVNLGQNEHLIRTVLDAAGVRRGERVLDLFCGVGNLSLPAAAAGASVLCVDRSVEAIRQARLNAAPLGAPLLTFKRGGSDDTLARLRNEGTGFDLVILNPPRSGAKETVRALPALGPARIVMVSCDPATFARDSAILAEGGYRLRKVHPLDFFPQTFHVETVGLYTPHP